MVLKRFILSLLIALVLSCLLGVASVSAKPQYTLKFATLVPPDTAWMKEIDRWAEEVYEKSNGRLKFKIYPGGVMGDERMGSTRGVRC